VNLLFGEVADLEASLNRAENGVPCDDPHDAAFGNHGHLVDILALHPFENAENRFFR